MQNETVGLHDRKCKQCGKQFEARMTYRYYRGSVTERIYFCSWHCLRDYERAIMQKTKRRPNTEALKVLKMLKAGKTMTEISEELGLRCQRISEIRDRWENWEVRA